MTDPLDVRTLPPIWDAEDTKPFVNGKCQNCLSPVSSRESRSSHEQAQHIRTFAFIPPDSKGASKVFISWVCEKK